MENLGMLIRKRRKELALKVYELANKVDVNPVYITQIEKHNKLPSVEVFEKIKTVLKLNSPATSLYLNAKYPEVTKNQLKILFQTKKAAAKLSVLMKNVNKNKKIFQELKKIQNELYSFAVSLGYPPLDKVRFPPPTKKQE